MKGQKSWKKSMQFRNLMCWSLQQFGNKNQMWQEINPYCILIIVWKMEEVSDVWDT